MDQAGWRSAIVVPIVLPAALEAIRLSHVDNARLGVPAHVTLLFPFVPAPDITGQVVARARAAIAGIAGFDVTFHEVTSFDPGPASEGVVWLAPDPPRPFRAMTESLGAAFPDHPPYEGLHDEVIPHLTLAERAGDIAGLQNAVRPHLPFRRSVSSAVLLVEEPDGRWQARETLPLR